MSYEVLARKWRPQQFDDVVGQEHVVQTLKNAIQADRIAHAYLFVGPRGIGKTSIARIFAKALNCAKGPTAKPCETCDSCKEIAAGSSLDVMEIDGASNNGVEQVRDLRDSVRYAPMRGRYKIYIIDEVHMLSTAAFNALLKTLEEPPPYVKFMFATTEPEKLLATIVSRCQRFDLRRIPMAMIVDRLRLIAVDEGVTIDDDALLAVARGAEGGLRDAESAMDQLIAFRGKHICEADVLSVFGLVARATLEKLAERIVRSDMPGIIQIVAELDQAGKDLQRVVVELMEHFRNLLVCLHVDRKTLGLDLTEGQIKVLLEQAALTDTDRLLRIADILGETEQKMRYALSRRTLLETALIRVARAAAVVSLDEILSRINELRGMDGGAPAGAPAPQTPRKTEPRAAETTPAYTTAARPAKSAAAEPGGDDELTTLKRRWPEIVEKVGKIVSTARHALADAQFSAVCDDKATIAFDPEFTPAAPHDDKVRRAVESVISVILGRRVAVEFAMATGAKGPAAVRDEAPDADAGAAGLANKGAMGAAASPAPASKTSSRSIRDWANDPAVEETVKIFGGSVVDVRE